MLGWTAGEAAELLDTSVPAVNSALQRARRTLDREAPASPDTVSAGASGDEEAVLLERYMRAWEDADMKTLAALLREDAVLTMPPAPSWYAGRDAIVEFFATSPFVYGEEPRRMRLVPTRANNQPAFAAYVSNRDTEPFEAYGFMVLRIEEGAIAEITGFADASLCRFFGCQARWRRKGSVSRLDRCRGRALGEPLVVGADDLLGVGDHLHSAER